jgi:hypothetical protein
MKVAGNMNPIPTFEGIKKSRNDQSGNPLCMRESEVVPMTRKTVPVANGNLRRRVHVMRNPVAVPTADEKRVGTTRRRPELVALSSKTAWK